MLPQPEKRSHAMPVHRLKALPLGAVQSLKARTYDALKAAIVEMNIYAPDAELKLDERNLSRRLGISRTPLREALALLDRDGIVKTISRRGVFIVKKTKREAEDLVTVWATIESLAAGQAATSASEAEIEALEGFVDRFVGCADVRPDEYADANMRFHEAIIDAARNPVISDLAGRFSFHVRAIRQRVLADGDRVRLSLADHAGIVAAIKTRDAVRAECLARRHALQLREYVAQFEDLN